MIKAWLKRRKDKAGQTPAAGLRRHTASAEGIELDDVSAGAWFVCEKLQNAGYDGYLVGGCVRDELLGKHPKDFDVVTNAYPEQVVKLFQRSRVIGRRFKIVHVRYKRELIEVATYRAAPDDAEKGRFTEATESGRLLRDNEYGTLESDAARRDFTANALYLDPINDLLLEYQNGVSDCRKKHLEVIGNPEKRFREDPVRMLRAIRFKAKLDFSLSRELEALIRKHFGLMREVSNARLFDETFKLFHHAHAVKSWETLKAFDALKFLFPATQRLLSSKEYPVEPFIMRAMQNTDRRVAQDKPVIPAFFFAVLLWYPVQARRASDQSLPKGKGNLYRAAEKIIAEQYPVIAIPKRHSGIMIEIWEMQWQLENRHKNQILRLLDTRRFRAAYDFLLLRTHVGEVDKEISDWWTKIQDASDAVQDEMIHALPSPKRAPRKRKRGGRGRAKKS